MPEFSQRSKQRLLECHPDLQSIFAEVIKQYDCTILCGRRSLDEQKKLVAEGKSKTLNSKHLLKPSLAVDVAPYPIDWRDTDRFIYLAGIVKGIATGLNIEVRWGGDWDSDNDFNDQRFNDLVHFEVRGKATP